MKAFFIDGDMRLVEVNGNVLVVYYPVEEKDSSLIMMNYSEGGLLKMYLKERRMERGVLLERLPVQPILWTRFHQIRAGCLLLFGSTTSVRSTRRTSSSGGLKSR